MPSSRKKRRAAQAADEDVANENIEAEEVENRSGRRSRSASGRKRHRNNNDDGGGGGEEIKHDKNGEEDDGQREGEDREDLEEETGNDDDDGGEEEEEEEQEDISSTTSPLRERHVNPTGKPAEAGIIDTVYVENFMCHRKLTVKLCRNVNFIHGQNGSGKSAILAAIQVCLGAGARRTHRARNLKDLVRKESGADCSGAKLRVTLLNRGADGYKPDIYGDYITVERSISLRPGGFNGYKLLNAAGKECSRSKRDLDAMLDQLNIQVENPVAVLDQEEAKKFLTGKAEDKYEFFTKATEIERLDRTYANIQDSILEQKEVQEKANRALDGAIENTKRLKKEWEQFKILDKLGAECQDYRAMYAWAAHMEFKAKLENEMKTAHKYGKSLEKRRVELEKAEQAANVTDDEETQQQKRLTELTEEATAAAATKTKIEQELKRAEAPLKQKVREKEVLVRESSNARRKLKAAQRRLDETRRQIIEQTGNAAKEERDRTEKIATLESDLAVAKERVDPLKTEIQTHLKRYQDIEPMLGQMKEAREGTERQLHAVQKRVKDLQAESGEGNSLTVFGPKCKALHEAVQKALKAKKFKGSVIGPVGKYVKVINGKEKYAKLAELAIGPGQLDRFIVTNTTDMELMKKLRKDVGCGPRDCALYQIHPNAAKEKYKTPKPPDGVELVTSVLSIDNPIAFNFLVDSARADQSALAESMEKSEQVLYVNHGNGHEAIRFPSVKKVYSLPKGDYWEIKANHRVGVSNLKPMKQTVGVDRTAAIDAAKHELKAVQNELARNRSEEDAVKKEEFESKKAWNSVQKEHMKLMKKIKEMAQQLDDLKAEAETSEEAPTIDTSELESDVQDAEMTVEDLKKQVAEIEDEIESLHPGIEDLKRQLDETTARNDRIEEDLVAVESKLEDIVKGHARRQEAVEKLRANVKKHEEALEQQEVIIQSEKANVSAALETAKKIQFKCDLDWAKLSGEDVDINVDPTEEDLAQIGIREDITKDSKYYKQKILAMEKKIELEKNRRNMSNVDPADARDKYLRAKNDLDSKMAQIDTIKRHVLALEHDLKDRRKRWRQFRSHIAQMTSLSFDEFLNKKGSSGEVEFDHEAGQLNLIVQKDNKDQKSQTKDVKALSGGERSYATLSLLLAIGESLETPFRVMDEFDVFLDPVARKIALKTLVKTAKSMEHRQFIFITPQDVSNLTTDPKLKIFTMKPPARNAIVGGPQQQTID
ncbi:hypothetical protein ACHAXS_010192 [Conticribra weissflogii]